MMTKNTGNLLWSLLDDFAKQYPDAPSESDVRKARLFFNAFDQMLQSLAAECNCHTEWRSICQRTPMDLRSRETLTAWCIAAHDWVNYRLGKELYDARSQEHAIFKRKLGDMTLRHKTAQGGAGPPSAMLGGGVRPGCRSCGSA